VEHAGSDLGHSGLAGGKRGTISITASVTHRSVAGAWTEARLRTSTSTPR
jgi:hypothetical protein